MQPADAGQLCEWVLALLRDYSAANRGTHSVAPSAALQRDHAAQQVGIKSTSRSLCSRVSLSSPLER